MASTIHPPRWLPILPDGTREERSGADSGLAERVNEALDELAEALARQAPGDGGFVAGPAGPPRGG